MPRPRSAPAELSVGHGAQADPRLHGERFADALVLHLAQRFVVVRAEGVGRGLRAEEALARRLEALGAKQAADLVGAKGRPHGAAIFPQLPVESQNRFRLALGPPQASHGR